MINVTRQRVNLAGGPVTPQERKDKLDGVAELLVRAKRALELLQYEATYDVDKRAIKVILTDLSWGVENCTVVGLHQVGEALDDTMGYGTDGIAR